MNPLKLLRFALAGYLPFGPRYCVACDNRIWRYMPYRNGSASVSELLRALNIVGSDVAHFECPRCGAHDRERHLILYMKASGICDDVRGKRVVHFAPERRLSRHLQSLGPADYVACDLFPQSIGVQTMDITRMSFADESVDILIANHVLEHVDDDRKALCEIVRVLRPGGHAILQTPYCAGLHSTWWDPGITTADARLAAYGQEDHVRLYGRDIVERFAASGLNPQVSTHEELLPKLDIDLHGVNASEPFFRFVKPRVPRLGAC
jgi:hypothetical protein